MEHCYNIFKKKYASSTKRRIIYSSLGIAFVLWMSISLLFEHSEDTGIFCIVMIPVIIFLVAANIIKIRQMKSALKVKPYSSYP